MFGSFSILMGIFVYFFIPETKGLSLESMDELFGITEDVKQINDDPERAKVPSVHENEHADRKI